MIEKLLAPILAPFRNLKSSILGVKNVADNIGGDKKRVQNMVTAAKADVKRFKEGAKGMADKAKGAHEQAKGAYGQAQGYMGQAQGAVGQAQAHMQSMGGPPGAPPAPGMPMPPPGAPPGMMPPPGGMMPGPMMGGPPMAGRPGMPPPMMGPPGQPMPMMGGPPMGGPMMGGAPMGGPMMGGAPPGPGVRTMAIMAGGTAGAAIGWLVGLKGNVRGELFTLKVQSVIGKDPTCEIIVTDPFMSGKHATIRANNGAFVLEDHSTNGTWVNDKKIKKHDLVDSDIVRFGQTILKFKAL
jgi:hypothetical protein